MFDLNPNDFITPKEKCLYNIYELLKTKQPEAKQPEIKQENKIQCKYCNGVHENKGQVMACAKKRKKESAK